MTAASGQWLSADELSLARSEQAQSDQRGRVRAKTSDPVESFGGTVSFRVVSAVVGDVGSGCRQVTGAAGITVGGVDHELQLVTARSWAKTTSVRHRMERAGSVPELQHIALTSYITELDRLIGDLDGE